MTGTPIHIDSKEVVTPLYGNVSREISTLLYILYALQKILMLVKIELS